MVQSLHQTKGHDAMWNKLFAGSAANLLIAVVSALLLVINTHVVKTEPGEIDLTDYTLTFCDEFDGDSLNTQVWHTHNSNGLRKGGYWSDSQCSVSDGSLVITTEYKEDGEFGAGWYTGALATSGSFEQTYGYYECRCILPEGQGLWSAFWLTCHGSGKENGTGRLGAELDVFESPYGCLPGRASWKVTSNIHYNGYGLATRYKNVVISALGNDPYENYNTYGLLWTEDGYVYYINGTEVGRSSFGGVSEVPEYMVISCEIDGAAGQPTPGWSGDIRLNREGRDFSSEFTVDYIRAYSLPSE